MMKIDASCYQKNFYLEWKLDPDSIKYDLSLLFAIRGPLDIQVFEQLITQFINYGQNQRTFFIEEENKLKQIVVDPVKQVALEFYDISQLKEKEQEKSINQLLKSINQHRFNLQVLPLYRYALIKRSNEDYLFTSVWHHIVGDGAFLDHFVGFISRAYNALLANKAVHEPKLADINEYIDYEKKYYSQDDQKRDLTFWEKELVSADLHVNLPKIIYFSR